MYLSQVRITRELVPCRSACRFCGGRADDGDLPDLLVNQGRLAPAGHVLRLEGELVRLAPHVPALGRPAERAPRQGRALAGLRKADGGERAVGEEQHRVVVRVRARDGPDDVRARNHAQVRGNLHLRPPVRAGLHHNLHVADDRADEAPRGALHPPPFLHDEGKVILADALATRRVPDDEAGARVLREVGLGPHRGARIGHLLAAGVVGVGVAEARHGRRVGLPASINQIVRAIGPLARLQPVSQRIAIGVVGGGAVQIHLVGSSLVDGRGREHGRAVDAQGRVNRDARADVESLTNRISQVTHLRVAVLPDEADQVRPWRVISVLEIVDVHLRIGRSRHGRAVADALDSIQPAIGAVAEEKRRVRLVGLGADFRVENHLEEDAARVVGGRRVGLGLDVAGPQVGGPRPARQ